MPHYQISRRVNFSAQNIFSVVADVQHYAQFLPLVKRSTISDVQNVTASVKTFQAELLVGYPTLHINETFFSHIEADDIALTVKTSSTGKAISKLEALWKIIALSEYSSEIRFSVDYQMRSLMMQLVMGGVFDQAVKIIIHAFEKRTAQLYKTTLSNSPKA